MSGLYIHCLLKLKDGPKFSGLGKGEKPVCSCQVSRLLPLCQQLQTVQLIIYHMKSGNLETLRLVLSEVNKGGTWECYLSPMQKGGSL